MVGHSQMARVACERERPDGHAPALTAVNERGSFGDREYSWDIPSELSLDKT